MSTNEEPDRMNAAQKVDRQIVKWAAGGWLACVVIAFVMILLSQLEYRLAMKVGAALMFCMSAGCFFLWRRCEKGSLVRGFSSILGILSLIAGILWLMPTGVTQWG